MAMYKIATCMESGEWDIIETFGAAGDTEANHYAEQHYNDIEWYVLDASGQNING